MLTKTDLKQIRGIVQEEVGVIVDKKLDDNLKPVKKDLTSLRKDVEQIGQIVDEKLDIKLKPIKKDLRYLKKTVNLIVANYDEADVKLQRRVRKIEHHLALPEEN